MLLARIPATPYLHAALRALAGNLFLESGVRSRDLRAGAARGGSILFVVTLHENGICESVSAGKSVPCLLLSLVVPQGFGAFQKQASHGSGESPGLWRFLLVQSLRRRDSPAG